ncbi:MAG: AAA family ATPase, partial [Thaumarchaeota archaeon]|nr:AAA family ATPase [Nitrososphaerota archaeon]
MMWVEKHRPSHPAQMVGNEDSRIGFVKWLRGWTSKSKPALLLGPAGTGKTTVVHVAAKMLGYRLFELNASDTRTREHLEKILGPLTRSTNLFGEKTLVFLDEVDGLHGRQDYGGWDYVSGLFEEGVGPLVMAANDEDDDRIRKLAGKCSVYRFKPVSPRLVELYLRNLLEREGASLSQHVLEDISSRSRGDVRGAVNDLQIAVEAPSAVSRPSYGRTRVLGSKEGVDALSRAVSIEEAVNVIRSWDAQPQDKLRILFRSVLSSKLGTDALSESLEALARADELL